MKTKEDTSLGKYSKSSTPPKGWQQFHFHENVRLRYGYIQSPDKHLATLLTRHLRCAAECRAIHEAAENWMPARREQVNIGFSYTCGAEADDSGAENRIQTQMPLHLDPDLKL
ncbi:hypothetical protein EYF80_062916 [Liparis tanakae]|uniref:Uncharacterized protein n=1 Tax=Liparis tanakae TaxID=230148 RepID=A0A4Z2EF48_9TELE|nr:hypothetical protein EYF80_062916 [Liparis tanakae]